MIVVYLATILSTLLAVVYLKYLVRIRKANEPPIPKGSLILGNAKELGENAVKFIQKTKRKLGDVFTIRILHDHLTIVTNPHDYDALVQEKNFSFQIFASKTNWNVFRFISNTQMLKNVAQTMKGSQLNNTIKQYAKRLKEAFANVTKNKIASDWYTDDLSTFGSTTLFSSLFYTFFGKDQEVVNFEPEVIFKNYDNYNKYFNFLAPGLPRKIFPKAEKAFESLILQPGSSDLLARDGISDYMKIAIQYMLDHGDSPQNITGHNLAMIHLNYNTNKAGFWAIYYLMQHPKALHALREELQNSIQNKRNKNDDETFDDYIEFTMEEIESFKLLDSAIKETLRLCTSALVLRYVMEDTEFHSQNGKTYSLRKGDKIAMYPTVQYQDPEIFENPEEYKFDRFVDSKFYKDGLPVKHPILSFGAKCLGKKFVLSQLKWFLLTMLNTFDFELLDGEKTEINVLDYGHEVLSAVIDVQMRYKLREDRKKVIILG